MPTEQPTQKNPGEEFRRDLERETLHSERLRTALLTGMFLLLGTVFTLGPVLAPVQFAALAGDATHRLQFYSALVFFGFTLYSLFARFLFGYFLRHDRKLPAFGRYANALIETSAPTAIILLFMHFLPANASALNTPAPYAYMLFIVLSTLRLDARLSLFTGVVAAAEFAAIVQWTYHAGAGTAGAAGPFLFHSGKVGMLLLGGTAAAFVAWQIRLRLFHSFRLLQERNRVTSIFGQHVSPAVVEALLRQQEQTESRHVCVMFLDIRNFTSFSEKRTPEEVVAFLNQIFSFCIEIINRHNGIINKFLGDGFMAVFGAPLSDGRDVRNAVDAASEIIRRMAQEVADGALPDTTVGIGLHAGEAVTGNVGSASRKEYTVIGDVVNLASRIEQLNKQFSSQLLMSEEVRQFCDDLTPEFVSETQVKGRETPVRIYRLA